MPYQSTKYAFLPSLKHSLLVGLLVLWCGVSWGQTNIWDGSASNSWNNADNWSLNQVPTAAHDIIFETNANSKNQFTGPLRLTDLVFQMGTFATLQGEEVKVASQSQTECHSLTNTESAFNGQTNHTIRWSTCGVVGYCSTINSRP